MYIRYPYSAILHGQAIFCHRLSSLPPLHATCLRCRGVTGSAFGDLGLCTWGRHRGIWGITRQKVYVIRLYIAFLHLIGWISSASKDFWLWKCQPVFFGYMCRMVVNGRSIFWHVLKDISDNNKLQLRCLVRHLNLCGPCLKSHHGWCRLEAVWRVFCLDQTGSAAVPKRNWRAWDVWVSFLHGYLDKYWVWGGHHKNG